MLRILRRIDSRYHTSDGTKTATAAEFQGACLRSWNFQWRICVSIETLIDQKDLFLVSFPLPYQTPNPDIEIKLNEATISD